MSVAHETLETPTIKADNPQPTSSIDLGEYVPQARALFKRMLKLAKSSEIRSMSDFVTQELVIPDGPYQGRKFDLSRQPYTKHLFECIDSGNWNRMVFTGPTQSGKTLAACIGPLMYHLFEVQESVIFVVPAMDMAGDKWVNDLRPAIEASRYRNLLPTTGSGSRASSKITSIQFKNGVTLRFMSGGGSDKQRAGFTARVVIVTETDGLDERGGNSREADKITQVEARTQAYGSRKRIYMECTTSIAEGRTWVEYQNGTRTQLVLPCPHCNRLVTPEREHLRGWDQSENVVDAMNAAHLTCPSCEEPWTESERKQANLQAQLLHRGQYLSEDGTQVLGEPTPTDTLGFRWNAANNLFVTMQDAARTEYLASTTDDNEDAERSIKQFWWAEPYTPLRVDLADLDTRELMNRLHPLPRNTVPDACEHLTAGIDVGDRKVHWTVIAWDPVGSGKIVSYGWRHVPTGLIADQAVLQALRDLRDELETTLVTPQGEIRPVDAVFVDAHYRTPLVKGFCKESGAKYQPSIGFGTGNYHDGGKTGTYTPKSTGSVTRYVKDRYHAAILKGERDLTWQFDADYWKTMTHDRLSCPDVAAGAMSIYTPSTPAGHQDFCRHLTAEKKIKEFVPGDGDKIRWQKLRDQNHWLDSTVLAVLMADLRGVKVKTVTEAPPPQSLSLAALRPTRR